MSSSLSWPNLSRPRRERIWCDLDTEDSPGPDQLVPTLWGESEGAGQHSVSVCCPLERLPGPAWTNQRTGTAWADPWGAWLTAGLAAGQNIGPEGRGRDVTGGAGWGRRRQNTQSPVTRATCHTEWGEQIIQWWPDTDRRTRVLRAPTEPGSHQKWREGDIKTLRSEPRSWPSPTRGTWRAPPPGASPGSSSSGREAHCHQTF